jgi:hypothetical protein
MEGDSLSASLPELHFLQGLTTYLRFRQGLLGTWPEVPDSILRRGQLLLLSYEQSEDRASRPFASGVAAQMRALMDLLRTRSGEPETVRATDALDAAVDQAPGCAEVIDMEALLELRNQFEASGLDWKPTEVEGLFKRALAADPKNENASNNLSAFYRLVDSTRASRPTPKKFALPADRIQVAQTTIRMINALVRVRSDSSALSRKYDDLGGSGAFLGEPTSEERPTYGRQGRYREYRGGSIYWSPETGAHEVHGVIRDKWRSLGGEGGSLGFPITDETSTPDGIGRYNHFRGGSIYWTPGTGAFEVNGLIGARWAEMGRERSVLGYPVTDETSTSDGVGRFNHFLNGSIYWTPDTGAHEVFGQIRERWKSMGWEHSTLGYPTTGVIVAADGLSRYQRFQHGVLHWSPSGEVTESQE